MIPLAVPNMTGKEAEYVADAISRNQPRQGDYVGRFERMVAESCGREWCVAVNAGTSSIHLMLYALQFSGEVETAAHCFQALSNTLKLVGCQPIYCDWEINHDGTPVAEERRPWPYFVDAAPAVGIKQSDGIALCLSFNGNKTVTTGQGGAIVGDDLELEYYLRKLAVPKFGGLFNYAMANVNAAIGVAQMERLEEFLEKKATIWQRYADSGLSMVDAGESRWMSLMRGPLGYVGAEFEAKDFWPSLDPSVPDRGLDALPCSTS